MVNLRFRRIERDGDGSAKRNQQSEHSGNAEAQPPPTNLRRSRLSQKLEHAGSAVLNRRGPLPTHFCRSCEAENSIMAQSCFNCGASIGGPNQEAFDASVRAERLAAKKETEEGFQDEEQDLHPTMEEEPYDPHSWADKILEEYLLSGFSRWARLGWKGRAKVVVSLLCIFALSLAAIHLFPIALTVAPIPWRVGAEVIAALGLTYLIKRRRV